MTPEQMAADMRATQTSRVADATAVLDELVADNAGYRQYCELVGMAQTTGGVVAPYSRREVAYYEISCYRIENHGRGDVETLVAHETSIDPFFFTDDSCDAGVYVDVATFGDDVILVNSTNHVEGPGSEFAQAADAAGGRTGAVGSVTAIVGRPSRGVGMTGVVRAWAHALVERSRAGLGTLEPRLAVAGVGSLGPGDAGGRGQQGHVLLAGGRGPGGPGGGRPGGGPGGPGGRPGGPGGGPGRPPGRAGGPGPRPAYRPVPAPRPAPRPMAPPPPNLGGFLGGFLGVPRPRPRPRGGTGELLTGMALGTLLGSLASKGDATTAATDAFCGYRLVENVVPLGSPVYCIGELYRSGERYHMGRSLSKDYPTSYFATRPEAEVLSSLGR